MQRFGALIVGIIFLGVGVFLYFNNQYLVKNCTEEAIATVVNMEEELSADDNGTRYMYYPIIEYNAGGEKVREKRKSGSSTPAYSINEKIMILYNPNKVKEFIIKGDKMSNIFSYVFIALGVLITGYGIKTALQKN